MTLIQVRRDTAANWATSNPVLSSGEWGFDTTNKRWKLGNGTATWKTLGWAAETPLLPPPSTSWTAFNSGSVTDDTDSRRMNQTNASSDPFRGEVRTLSPTSNYTATVYLDVAMPPNAFFRTGLILRNATSGSFIVYGPAYDSGVGSMVLWASTWTNPTAINSSYLQLSPWTFMDGIPRWLRIRDDNTSRFYEHSVNGVDWILFNSTTRTDFITADQVGWAVSANSGTAGTIIARLRHFAIT